MRVEEELPLKQGLKLAEVKGITPQEAELKRNFH